MNAATRTIVKAIDKATDNKEGFEEYVSAFVTLQRLAQMEANHAQEVCALVNQKASVFYEFHRRVVGCSYEEMVDLANEIYHDERYLPDGTDTLLAIRYSEYLKTPHWKSVREYAVLRAGNRCQLCNSTDRLEVHHRTYEGKGMEDYSDVVALCHKCHAKFHGKE